MSNIKFKTNINCSNCIKSVTPILNQLDCVDEWKVDTENPNKVLEVELDNGNYQEVIHAITAAGFSIELI